MLIETRVSQTLSRLVLDRPWYGVLAVKLAVVPSDEVKTFDVDGTTLRYNPVFCDSLTDRELRGVICHEVLHCALLHPFRCSGRNPDTFNRAADYAINQILTDEKFTLPKGALLDARFKGLSADQIYSMLRTEENPSSGSGKPADASEPNPLGEVKPAPTSQPAPTGNEPPQGGSNGQQPQPQPANANDATGWAVAVEQATNVASKAGDIGGGLANAVKASHQATTDWRSILREFVERTIPSGSTWASPNRRHVGRGLYLPGTRRENTPRLAVGLDTSGSVSEDMLRACSAELTAILNETRPESLTVYSCDVRVNGVEVFMPDDNNDVTLNCVGRGGTRFQPVFDWIDAEDSEPPAALIYFTDLCGPEPEPPAYPVLWIVPEHITANAWFGVTVRVGGMDC